MRARPFLLGPGLPLLGFLVQTPAVSALMGQPPSPSSPGLPRVASLASSCQGEASFYLSLPQCCLPASQAGNCPSRVPLTVTRTKASAKRSEPELGEGRPFCVCPSSSVP